MAKELSSPDVEQEVPWPAEVELGILGRTDDVPQGIRRQSPSPGHPGEGQTGTGLVVFIRGVESEGSG